MPVCAEKLCKNNTTRNKNDTGITHTAAVDIAVTTRAQRV